MTLRTCIDDINTRLAHPFSEADLVRWLNTAMREVYRHIALCDGLSFRGRKKCGLYPLTPDITFSRISAVVVDGKEYRPARIGEALQGGTYYKAAEGFLGLFPAPRRGSTVSVYYFAKPPVLQPSAAMDGEAAYNAQEIELDEDFSELLCYSVMSMIAEAQEDIALANNYKTNYNLLLTRARQERCGREGKYPITRQSAAPRWRRY